MNSNDPSQQGVQSRRLFWLGLLLSTLVLCALGAGIAYGIWYFQKPDPQETVGAVNNAPVQVEQKTSIDMSSLRHTMGSGEYAIVEYADLESSFSKTFHPVVVRVAKDYDGKLQYAMKHFPLNVHTKSLDEALAAECAGQQGKFFEYVDRIYEVTPSNNNLDSSELEKAAETVGLNMENYTSCVENRSFQEDVAADALEAMATGATGTPHTLIVDKEGKILSGIRGSLSEAKLREAIDAALAR